MKKRIYNTTHYHKEKVPGPSKPMVVAADEQDKSKLYSQLESKLKKRKKNLSAITQLQEFTLKKRSVIDKVEDADVTKKVLEKFPFLNKEAAVSKNKLSSSKIVSVHVYTNLVRKGYMYTRLTRILNDLCCANVRLPVIKFTDQNKILKKHSYLSTDLCLNICRVTTATKKVW